MRKHRNISVKYRWLAFLLCVAVCAGSSPMQVFADTSVDSEKIVENVGTSDGLGHEDEAGASENGGNERDIKQEDGAESDAGDGVSAGGEESDQNGDTESEAGDDVSTDEGEVENPEEGTDTPVDKEKPGEDNTEEPEQEQISGNTLDTISENTLESISENSLDEERQAMIKKAEAAFDALLAEKPLMALLYRTEQYDLRKKAEEDSAVAATLEIGQTLYIQGVTITENDVWYRVQYWLNGAEGTGYVQSCYLAYSDEDWLAWEEEYLFPILALGEDEYEITAYGMAAQSMVSLYAVDTSDISAFPGSYQSALKSLKSAHPNWTFVPMKTGLDFNSAVSNEMGAKSLIQNTTSNASKGWVGSACPTESGWNYAKQPAVAYYMDPRNFLTESYIFQFEQLTFNSSYHTEAAVQSFLNGTFMKGTLPDDSAKRTYAKAFYEIGKNRRLSPIHLASRVYQEQGQGTSGLISGNYPGYIGYYNFFNVGVNGSSESDKIKKGLEYAKSKGWNTRYKSLEGGAATIGNNYILKYQDTIYLEKFNVDKNSPYGVYNHQYMQNIQAPASESTSTKKMYSNAGSLNSAFVFKIPVYENMPNEYPTLSLNKTSLTMNKGETQQLILSADGVALDESEATWTSSDSSVATVKDGMVTAVDKGEAVITASYQEVEVSCKVTVKIPLQSISLDKTEIRLRRPDTVVADTTGLSAAEKAENTATAVLQVSFNPADTTADRSITWTSSNAKVAAVKADPEDPTRAVVSAVGTGEVTITAKASKAGNKTAACKVSVSAPIYRLELRNLNALETDPADRTTLFAGQSINLSAEYWPKDTTSDTKVAWSSSNEKVAVVKNGKVTAIGEDPKKNTAVITAKVAGCEKGYEASYTIVLERCTVTFMKPDGKALSTETLSYGDTLHAETIQAKEKALGAAPTGSVFIGWYTGKDGTGSRFDENTSVHEKNITLYPYYVKRGEGFYVLPIGDQTYTGSVIKPKLQVYDGMVNTEGELLALTAQDQECLELVEGRDYTVSYKNNKNVNLEGKPVPTITVKGKGNYTGTQQVTFNIIPKALTDTDITADDITVAYNGRVIKSLPTVYRDGKKLIRNADYTVTYPLTEKGAYQTAGIHPIVITGKGGYTGKITVYENITKEVLLSKVSVASIPKQTYTNEQMKEEGGIRPASLKVTYQREPLVEGEHYTVSYSEDQGIGKATATLTAVEGSGYIGSKSVTYQIVGTPITKAKVSGLVNKEYTGTENDMYQSGYSLTIGEKTLKENLDYTVSYQKTDKAGTATIIFMGINEYNGQLKKTYRILPYELKPERVGTGQDITVSYYTQDKPKVINSAGFDGINISGIVTPYVRGGSKPTILLSFHGQELTPGKDYSISYRNNNALTTTDMEEKKLPTFTLTGKGNFKGKLTGTFKITEGKMKDQVTMTLKDVVYRERKGAYKTTAVLRDVSGTALTAGRDYDKNLRYTYEKAVEVGLLGGETALRDTGDEVQDEDIPKAGTTIRVTARGIGAYQGDDDAECSEVYRIVAADFTKVRVKVAVKNYQDGRAVLLAPDDLTLTVNGVAEPLVLGTDYKIEESTYSNNTKKGRAKVTLRGIGNYGGEKTITYTIGAKTLWW